MNTDKLILDACCGSRMFWFDKNNPLAVFADIRSETHILCDGRELHIKPDVCMDFRSLQFADKAFKLVVFDPPHLRRVGQTSWLAKKYGSLTDTWKQDLKQGFSECMRVLQDHGILIFKWNSIQVTTSDVIEAIGHKPLFGHTSGRAGKTIWMAFMKLPENIL
jgi:hypothetical protein